MNSLNFAPINSGKYIVAVSGGVDSVVLLNLLLKIDNLELIIAHVDHGIREDSINDLEFAKNLSQKHDCQFEHISLDLGKGASEEKARNQRYKFLRSMKQKYGANAIITAHHQDDVIETCFINLIRGTGTRGLSSLRSNNEIMRPLLNIPKTDLIEYAKKNKLDWHEDSTNFDKTILRNKLRHDVVPRMSLDQRRQLLDIIKKAEDLNEKLDKELAGLMRRGLHKGKPILSRGWFNKLPHDIACEVIRGFLLTNKATDIDKKTIERVVVSIKTLKHGKQIQAAGVNITLTKRSARLIINSKTDIK